jgi:cyanate permease
MDIAIANTAATVLPWLPVVAYGIIAVIAYAAAREFLERLRSELH